MTPEQSAAVAALDAAIDCFDFENLLGAVPITHDAFDDLGDACTPENIRALLAALDEAQRPPNNAQITAALDAWFGPCDQPEVRPFGVRMRAAIDAARARGAA